VPVHLATFQGVIDRAMAKKPEQRFQSGAEFAASLDLLREKRALPNNTVRSEAISTDELRAAAGDTFFMTPRDSARLERHSKRQRRRITRRNVLMVLAVALVGSGTYVLMEKPELTTRMLAWAGFQEDPILQNAWLSAQSLHRDPNQSLSAIVAGYRRVLALAPGHAGAEQAVAGLAAQWKAAIDAALLQDDLTQAETKLMESQGAFPEDPALADLAVRLNNRKHARDLLLSTQGLLRSHGLSDIPSATAAIQAYQEVLRLAPGNQAATAELNTLAEHYANLADTAIEEGDVQAAIGYVDRASAAKPSLARLADVRDKINRATTGQATINDLLAQARNYRAQNALINPPGANAAELYHRVLATAPGNTIAVQGLSEVTSQLIANAGRLVSDGNLAGAQALVERAGAVGIDPDAFADIRTRLAAESAKLTSVELLLNEARALLAQGFVTEPPERNAVIVLREVIRMDPGNAGAHELLARAAGRLADTAKAAFASGLTDEARQYLELALTVTPDVAEWQQLLESWN
jgi:tetratricopeptide (TPR) repeat protein